MKTTQTVRITGSTYPIRSMLRERGARWDGSAWVIAAEKWQELATTYHGSNKRGREIANAIAGCVATPVEE